MTHDTTNAEKRDLLEYIRELTLRNVLKKEDVDEIYIILQRACDRALEDACD